MDLDRLVSYLDEYLGVADYEDRSNNGLQVEGRREVRRVGYAVDACQEAFAEAAAKGVDLLVVHHGLYWGSPLMVTGVHRNRLLTLLQAGVSLYAAHLPLDAHPEVGNNAEMTRLLGLAPETGFGYSGKRPIGQIAQAPAGTTLESLRQRLGEVLGSEAISWPFREDVHRVAVVTGKATSLVYEALASGADTLVFGELEHSVYHTAKEAGLGVVLGGHYRAETLGLRALARHLESTHGLESHWIEVPTGL